jgi:class 3 adenylate cyclase
MADVGFEVYTYENGRWNLVRRMADREQATQYAEQLYHDPQIKGVRVVKETYNAATGGTVETTILKREKSGDLPKSLSASGAAAPTRGSASKASVAPAPAPQARAVAGGDAASTSGNMPTGAASSRAAPVAEEDTEPPTTGRIVGKLAIAIVMAGGLAIIALIFVHLLASWVPAFGRAMAAMGALRDLGTIAVIFVIAYFTLARTLLSAVERAHIFGDGRKGRQSRAAAGHGQDPRPADGETAGTEGPAAPPPSVLAQAAAAADPPPVSAITPAPTTPEIDEPAVAVLRAAAEQAESALSAFRVAFGQIFRGAPPPPERFACHLYLAGLMDAEADRLGWAPAMRRRLLAQAISETFGDPDRAIQFATGFEEYLTHPRYHAMYRAGVDMLALPEAIQRWNAPAATAAATAAAIGAPEVTATAVAIMITEIAGPRPDSPARDDPAHQVAIQLHDRVVRAVLSACGGREIKHTGGGIMAVFDGAADALRAATAIQREARASAAADPAQVLELRVGIASGPPIRDDEDLTGTPVQLAARICAAAREGEVLVDPQTRELSRGGPFELLDMGDYDLRGFAQPQRLHALFFS